MWADPSTALSILFFPGDYSEGYELSREELEVDRVFSKNFPEGAVYLWNAKKQEWHYVGQMSDESQDGTKRLFDFFDVKPNPPL